MDVSHGAQVRGMWGQAEPPQLTAELREIPVFSVKEGMGLESGENPQRAGVLGVLPAAEADLSLLPGHRQRPLVKRRGRQSRKRAGG